MEKAVFGWLKKSVPGVIGMELSPFGTAVAYLSDQQQDGLTVADCQYFEGALDRCGDELGQWLQERHLDQVGVQIVLHPAMYRLYFIDRPDVEDEVLSEAVRWKIKDLVDEPLKDLVIDAFALPDDAYRGKQKKVYVVAIGREVLEEQVALLRRLPLKILGISISELADRSLLNHLHVDPGGAALLRLRSSTGTLNLIDSGALYLTRNIDTGVSVLETTREDNRNEVLDELLLEVQRCVDFYDSQLGKGTIRKMLVAPTRLDRAFFDDHLRNHLGMNVQALDLNEAFAFPEPLSGDYQSLCFAAVAAATEGKGLAA
jgi:MSHA biogenesis protein MshI